jgi:NTE family protein
MSLPFRALALGGGGVKGVLHVGALQELAKRQPLEFPEGIYGCSVGAIIATYVAFRQPLDALIPYMQTHCSLDAICPPFNISSLSRAFATKGLHTMETFEQRMIELFGAMPMRELTIKDAPMPLYIVASNITRGTPVIMPPNTLLMDALKASCCIPGMFRPHVIENSLFVDGVLLAPCIASMVTSSNTLILSLSKQRRVLLTPSVLEDISPIDYTMELYTLAGDVFYRSQLTDETVCLSYPQLHSNSSLSDFDVEDVLRAGGLQLNRFLLSKASN